VPLFRALIRATDTILSSTTMALDPKSSARARPDRPGSVIGIAVARFHEDLTGPMKDSAVRELVACGVSKEDIRVVWVPGSFELPLAARRLVEVAEVDAVLALGVVVKGETDHDHWVAHGAVSGLMSVSLEEDVPMHLGVLTCETMEQARARALPVELGGREDKGREVARSAIEMLIALDALDADDDEDEDDDDEEESTVDEEGFEARLDAGDDQ
jgi:6,7-dimethyl-8-ribityllumazine synthase